LLEGSALSEPFARHESGHDQGNRSLALAATG